jgi:uncharacterized protein
MRYLVVLLIALIPCLAAADDASHLAAAGRLIELVKTRESMRNAFISSVDALVTAAPAGHVSPAEVADMKQATADWFDQELDWNGLKAKLVDAYAQSFTEDELNQLVAFYKTPLGQKTLAQMPLLQRQAMVIGHEFATGKQTLWNERLQKIDEKYHPQAAAPAVPDTTSGNVLAPLAPAR